MPNEEYLDYEGLQELVKKIKALKRSKRLTNVDLNNIRANGFYFVGGNCSNRPANTTALYMIVVNTRSYPNGNYDENNNDATQIAIEANTREVYVRRCYISGSLSLWTTWQRLATETDIEAIKTILDSVQTTTDTVANVVEVPTSAKGLATLKRIGGMSWKVNQLVKNGNFSSNSNWGDYLHVSTISISNGVLTATTNNSGNNVGFGQAFTCEPNHKYLFTINLTAFSEGLVVKGGLKGVDNNTLSLGLNTFIQTRQSATDEIGAFSDTSVANAYISCNLFMMYDLTAMGIDTTDVDVAKAELLKRGIDVNVYNAYDSGSIRNSAVTKLLETGTNRWDEQWEVGSISLVTGANEVGSKIRSKNFIRVLPTTNYAINNTSNGKPVEVVCFYDANKNYLGSYDDTPISFVTPTNCYYIKFRTDSSYGTTYNHDICINVSNAEINGKYYPYSKHELAIPQAIISITGYGWGVNQNCYNYLDLSLNEYKPFKQFVGRVDLGSLDWVYNSSANCFIANLNNSKPSGSQWVTDNNLIISNSFIQVAYYYLYNANYASDTRYDKSYNIASDSNSLYVKDYAYTDGTAFKTAMSGVYLYYELATPVITDVSSLLDEVHIPIEANGTIEPVNTYNNAVPVIVSFDNGLVDVVLTNHEHDIEQQKEIDELYKTKNRVLVFTGTGQNIKTVGGFSLDGSGDIPFPTAAYHAYQLTLYANGYQPVFRTNIIISQNESGYSAGVMTKNNGLNLLKILSNEYTTDEYICQDIQPNASYWDGGQITVTCPNATAVQYLEGETKVNVIDNTGTGIETIDTSDIGDDDTASYYFYLHEV